MTVTGEITYGNESLSYHLKHPYPLPIKGKNKCKVKEQSLAQQNKLQKQQVITHEILHSPNHSINQATN